MAEEDSFMSMLTMPKNQIEIWSADLDGDECFEEQAYATLSHDEQERARCLYFPVHRSRYAVRRGVLRKLLGYYLGKRPEEISFVYGVRGKPFLRDERLHFSMSHSESFACFAFSAGCPLGIDIERIRPFPGLLNVAANVCTTEELSAIAAQPEEDQARSFFRCWTRKEALIKAHGLGLSFPLNEICVISDKCSHVRVSQSDGAQLTTLYLRSWEEGTEHLVALASHHPESKIVMRRFNKSYGVEFWGVDDADG